MRMYFFTIIMILLSIHIYSQTKSIKVLLDDGTERHFPISGTGKITKLTFVEDACDGVRKVTYSGKIYHAIQIGDQCWFKENLNVGTMINGSINQTSGNGFEKYCYNDEEWNCDTYGGLYIWDEAMQYTTLEGTQGICPSGWHIPSYSEMQTLQTYVNDKPYELLDESVTTSGYTVTNNTGFSALFTGTRISLDRGFGGLKTDTYFWSSTEESSIYAHYMYMYYNHVYVHFSPYYKTYGFSVRCLKN